ncbi:SH3 domain-containing protein [Luteipulveratus mongoliensis]|uniref:SH3b domain-containing protein n=1 Tax=Luteipulveratus mongoliensis TaxID=571913 RepID=A0A0K1JIL2_9MICO|nr:SH3 domain-containing protein [Luteipulveratus mongoliensis]AKU16418.1 hypothetical protein VV02_12000 [Luteipulveratus mongoliensis]
MKRTIAAACVLGAGLTFAATSTASAAPSSATLASCTINSTSTVTASALRVRNAPNGSTVVGLLYRGTTVHICSSGKSAGGHYWMYGYGNNGGTRVTGWMAADYLALP